ncbi:hypothetical protein BU15DRAFT_79004 [Melanogaster broomeanus]|nr:hypothetical protein BU15DRAFT_79004 [Melanogaster broomeanus]
MPAVYIFNCVSYTYLSTAISYHAPSKIAEISYPKTPVSATLLITMGYENGPYGAFKMSYRLTAHITALNRSAQEGTTTPTPLTPEQDLIPSLPSIVITEHDQDSAGQAKFAAGKNSTAPNKLVDEWLWDRSATRLSLLFSPDLDQVLKQYREFTRPTWPKEWLAFERLPYVDPKYDELKRQLFAARPANKLELLDGEIAQSLRSGFVDILRACKRSQELKEDAQRHMVLEVECRHEWDSLILEFMNGKTSVRTRMEQTIKLPRNLASDNVSGKNFVAHRLIIAADYEVSIKKTIDDIQRVRDTHPDDATFTQLLEQETNVLQSIVEGMSKIGLGEAASRKDLEPATGKCDALAAVEICNFIPHNAQKQLIAAVTKFTITTRALVKNPLRPPSPNLEVPPLEDIVSPPFNSAYDLFHLNHRPGDVTVAVPRTLDHFEDTAARVAGLSLARAIPGSLATTSREDPNSRSLASQGLPIDLPLLVVEYKKLEADFHVTGANQHRIYSTAAVSILAAAGITNFPVFSLLTEGCKGVVTCSLGEMNNGILHIRIVERNGVIFDISDPLSAFSFAVFLSKLAIQHSQALRQEFEKVRGDLLRRLGAREKGTRWSMAHQSDDSRLGTGKKK